MFRRYATTLSRLTEAYRNNPQLKQLVDEMKTVVKERPTSSAEIMTWMKNENVQRISSAIQIELEKENLSIMDVLDEMKNR